MEKQSGRSQSARASASSPFSQRVVSYLYLCSFVAGLLFAVRLLFFGAERRRFRVSESLPLRRSEPAGVAFLVVFGIAGSFLDRHRTFGLIGSLVVATVTGVALAAIVTRLAIATARLRPEHDPEDPRFLYQGRVATVTIAIPVAGEGMIRCSDAGSGLALRARDIDGGAIMVDEEVCIARVDDGVAYVERWVLVEQRL
jgi:hypothetical protein